MLLIPITQFLIFWVYVNFNSILMAFQKFDGDTVTYTLDNFIRFFDEIKLGDSNLRIAIKNTMSLFLVNIGIILPLSLLFAYFLYKKVFFHKGFRVIFFLPQIISSVILITLFKYIIAPTGPFNMVLSWITDKPISELPNWLGDPRYSFNTILVYCIWTGFAVNLVLITGAMSRIPKEIIEYGRLEGLSLKGELFKVIIPMIYPTLTTLIITTVSGMFVNMGPILPFTQGNFKTTTIGYYIFSQVKNNMYEYPAAIGLVFTFIGLPIVLLVKKLLNKIGSDVEY
ncbi:MAG: sugar ABC transporter permease [Acholeplasmataceae bacterium]|nr:sugar ABC transporter permease [Acholeplasmataceae bacterium]